VDFSLDDTQQVIAKLTGEVLDADPTIAALDQAGLLSLALPVPLGGDGLGPLETMVVLTEVGRRGLVLPVHPRLMLSRWGNGLTAALRSRATTDGTLVTGSHPGVPYAAESRRILVTTDAGVVGVDPAGDGVRLTPTHTASGQPEYTVDLDRAPVVQTVDADLEELVLAGACAFADGLLAGALALTTGYVRDRHQFGRPLATFQAVAQQIADVYIASRTLHQVTLAAGWRLATGRPAGADLAVAAYWLATELPPALRTCHHLHGGVGLDITYPLHRYSALAKDLVRSVGGAEHRLEQVALCIST
jgi:alkylation response protein AidB-like acyl-CoA dehydrogenase